VVNLEYRISTIGILLEIVSSGSQLKQITPIFLKIHDSIMPNDFIQGLNRGQIKIKTKVHQDNPKERPIGRRHLLIIIINLFIAP
jgi:hypothetical protein